jgi:hypothetical protein
MNSTDYKVSVGKIARTLLYEDSQGTICFTFDVAVETKNSPTGKWILALDNPTPDFKRIDSIKDEKLRVAEKLRLETAMERTKQFLISKGYEISKT